MKFISQVRIPVNVLVAFSCCLIFEINAINVTSIHVKSTTNDSVANIKIGNNLPASESTAVDKDSNSTVIPIDQVFKMKRKCCPKNLVAKDINVANKTVICEIPGYEEQRYKEKNSSNDVETKFDHNISEPFSCAAYNIMHPRYDNVSLFSNGLFDMTNAQKVKIEGYNDTGEVICVERDRDFDNRMVLFRCYDSKNDVNPLTPFYCIFKIVAAIFLIVLILLYMINPKRHTFHNQCLMRYMMCLLGKCIPSIIFYLNKGGNRKIQYLMATSTYFFYMASFCWSTAIAFSIWSSMRASGAKVIEKSKVNRRIRKYSICVWSSALLILLIAVSIDFLLDAETGQNNDSWLSDILDPPQFAKHDEWMGGNMQVYTYFYLPLIVLNVINLGFVVSTTSTLIKGWIERKKLSRNSECRRIAQEETKWFYIFVTLYIVIGISWLLDILSFELSDEEGLTAKIIMFSVDIFNICQGIFICIITITQKETKEQLKKRFSSVMMRASWSRGDSKQYEITKGSRSSTSTTGPITMNKTDNVSINY